MLILFCRLNSHFSRLHIMVFIYPFEFVHHYPPHSEQKEYIIKDEHQRSL